MRRFVGWCRSGWGERPNPLPPSLGGKGPRGERGGGGVGGTGWRLKPRLKASLCPAAKSAYADWERPNPLPPSLGGKGPRGEVGGVGGGIGWRLKPQPVAGSQLVAN